MDARNLSLASSLKTMMRWFGIAPSASASVSKLRVRPRSPFFGARISSLSGYRFRLLLSASTGSAGSPDSRFLVTRYATDAKLPEQMLAKTQARQRHIHTFPIPPVSFADRSPMYMT